MKWIIGMIAITSIFSLQAQEVSKVDLVAGTHVGSGDPTSPNERVIKLKVEISGKVDVNLNESKATADEIMRWCEDASRILRREFEAAQRLNLFGKLEEGSQVLVDALVAVNDTLSTSDSFSGPMIKTLAYRGLQMIRVLDDTLSQDSKDRRLTIVTKAYFLERYVSFMLEAATYLDRPFLVRYRYDYRRNCDHRHEPDPCIPAGFDIKSMMQRYLEMAARQIRFTNDFVDRKGSRVVPVGSPKAYLKISELTASFVEQDLRDNLYAIRNACEITDLRSLADRLRSFNDDDRQFWFNSQADATQYSYSELNRLATAIEGAGRDCERENRPCR